MAKQLKNVKFGENVLNDSDADILDRGSLHRKVHYAVQPVGRLIGGSTVGHNGVMVLGSDVNGLQYTEDGGLTAKQSDIVKRYDGTNFQPRSIYYSNALKIWVAFSYYGGNVPTYNGYLWWSRNGKTWYQVDKYFSPTYKMSIAENDGVIVVPNSHHLNAGAVMVDGQPYRRIALATENGYDWTEVIVPEADATVTDKTDPSKTGGTTGAAFAVSRGPGNGFLLCAGDKWATWAVNFSHDQNGKLTYTHSVITKKNPNGTWPSVGYNTAYVMGGFLYIGVNGVQIWKLDLSTGDWTPAYTLGGNPRGAVVVGDYAYICARDNKVYKVDANDTVSTLVTLKGTAEEPYYGEKPECITYDGDRLLCFGIYDATRGGSEDQGAIIRISLAGEVTTTTPSSITEIPMPEYTTVDQVTVQSMTSKLAAIKKLPDTAVLSDLLAILRA